MVSVAEKNQRPDIPAQPQKLPGGTFGGWDAYVALIQRCWHGELGERPSFEAIINVLRELLTASASQMRQRRMTDPSSLGAEGVGSPSGVPPRLAEDSTSPGELRPAPTFLHHPVTHIMTITQTLLPSGLSYTLSALGPTSWPHSTDPLQTVCSTLNPIPPIT